MLSKNPLYLLPVDKNINPVEKCIGMPSLLYEVISKPFGSESVGHGYLPMLFIMRQYTIYIKQLQAISGLFTVQKVFIRTEKLMNQINQRKKEREALVLGN